MTHRKSKLNVVYILPSRFDDEGHVYRYWRGVLPSNTLTCLQSLTRQVAEAKELGPDVEVNVEVWDDSVQRIPVERIVRRGQRRGARLVVGLVGVQTNQFPRADELARQFLACGAQVMIGGFHVSGVLALFNDPSPELSSLMNAGATLVRGEVDAPGVMAGILRDALEGSMKSLYNITESPDITDAPLPRPDPSYLRKIAVKTGTIDTSRGCPFSCTFCTIINVQGHKMRHRSAAAMLRSIEENYDTGTKSYFFTDDDFARSPVWEELFDGLIRLSERGKPIRFMMQVDTAAWKIRRFIEKAAEAGCFLTFIGIETINKANLIASGKRQNKVHQYAEMVRMWHRAGILVHAGYIIGFPEDSLDSVRADIGVLKDCIKVDEASFFMLTPLPGSRDHFDMVAKKVPLDADLNNYDSFHETFRHPKIAPGEWQALYHEAWDTFYSKENIVNLLLRAPRHRYWEVLWLSIWNRYSTLHRTHPMVTGFFRLKDRKNRRAFFPRESRMRYAWRRMKEMTRDVGIMGRLFFEFQEIWLLTREREDPRWVTLASLRDKWSEAQRRIADSDIAGRCDLAMSELRGMLKASSEHLNKLSDASKTMSRGVRRKMRLKALEIETYLQGIELQIPTWHHVVQAERYVSESLLTNYEELAIRYVAKRRRFNAYRRDLIERLKTGRLLTLNVSTMAPAMVFEVLLGLRFGLAFLTRR